MSLDVGSKRIGVALSDPGGTVVEPLTLLERKNPAGDAELICRLVKEHGVEILVFGLPYDDEGKETPQTRKISEFKDRVAAQLRHKGLSGVRIDVQDETMTTFDAHEELKAMGVSYAKRKDKVDKMAAVFILRGWLNSKKEKAIW